MKIVKRDGHIVDYEPENIRTAISRTWLGEKGWTNWEKILPTVRTAKHELTFK